MTAAIGIFELVFTLPFLLIGILGTVFWIWMLIDAALNEPSEGSDKIVWVLIILFTHFIGALIYFVARRPNRPPRFG
jgi:sterol desaturase/sphingolipid hydroxylase (fatty acid hydroxylase superfamily)